MSSTNTTSIEAQRSTRHQNLAPSQIAEAGFNQLSQAFECAATHRPVEYVEGFYTLANKVIHIRIVGRKLAAIYQRAFAPRATPSQPRDHVDLTIDLWDEVASGVAYPLPLAREEEERYVGDLQVQYGDESGRWLWCENRGSASWLDRKADRIIGWRAQAAAAPLHEHSKPLVSLLPVWFYDHGIHILHAGVVARNGAGILITGGSGIGKTTTTLACVLSGLDYLSDDQVAVARPEGGEGAFIAHSIFQSARVAPHHLQRFPVLQPHALLSHDPQDPKALLFLAELFPKRVVGRAAIRAIALPRLCDQAHTHHQRATRAEALNYMASTSLLTQLGLGRARFTHLTQLLGSAPCYWLNLGYDLRLIPAAIEELLAEAE